MILAPLIPGSAGSPPRATAERGAPTTLVYPPWKHNYGFDRFRQFHLTAYGGHGLRISSPQGIAAVKLFQNDDEGPGDDDELTVFGVNSGRAEIIYNRTLFELGGFDAAVDGLKLKDPVGIAADAAGNVAVADRGNDRVVVLFVDSDLRLQTRSAITLAETGKALSAPAGVAIESGRVYVTDSGNDRVIVLDTAGRFLAEFADSGAVLDDPFGIAVIQDPEWNHFGSAFMVVSACGNRKLVKLSLSGEILSALSYDEVSDRAGGFYFLAIDYFSNVYVTDQATGCVYKFDRNLGYVTKFECQGDDGGKLDEPRGIAIYRRFGQVFIAENTGASYYWVGTDVLNLSCRGREIDRGLVLTVRFFLTEYSSITARLETDDGTVLEVLLNKSFTGPGSFNQSYTVLNDILPARVADCELFVRVKAKPIYSSENYLEVDRITKVR